MTLFAPGAAATFKVGLTVEDVREPDAVLPHGSRPSVMAVARPID
jgi:hypothetical protein